MTSEDKLDLVLDRLNGVVRLLAIQTIAGKKAGDSAVLLDRARLERKLIAEVLGTSESSVRGLISLGKRKAKSSAKEG